MVGTLFGTLIMNVTHETQFGCKALWPDGHHRGPKDRGVVTGPPHRGMAVTQPHVRLLLVSSTALRISCVTASGCETMDACAAVTSSIRAFPRSAKPRCPSCSRRRHAPG
jgi:hypothetical protein